MAHLRLLFPDSDVPIPVAALATDRLTFLIDMAVFRGTEETTTDPVLLDRSDVR